MSTANPLWGAPRIHGELLKLGIQISQATVAKYMVRQRKPPPQTWRTFLENHVQQLVAIDFLVVPTVSFRLLFVFVVFCLRSIRPPSASRHALQCDGAPLSRRSNHYRCDII
jgi:hypothetical protein